MATRNRNEKKFCKWSFYFDKSGPLAAQRRTLREVAESRQLSGGRQLLCTQATPHRVDVEWPTPVGYDAAMRLVKLSQTRERSFKLSGRPSGVPGSEASATQAAPADPAAAAAAETADPAAAEERAEQGANEAAATPAGTAPGTRASCQESAASTAGRGSSKRPSEAETSRIGGDPKLPNVARLPLKLEAVCAKHAGASDYYEELPHDFGVEWSTTLGEGTYGKVFLARRRSDSHTAVAVKMIMFGKTKSELATAAEEEVRRHASLPRHHNIVGLLDVGLFFHKTPTRLQQFQESAPRVQASIGLVFDLYETDVRQYLKKKTFTAGGMRHVLKSIAEGLHFMHQSGLLHCDLKPANILMRGAGRFRGCFQRRELRHVTAAAAATPPEVQYQIPASFEVGRGTFADAVWFDAHVLVEPQGSINTCSWNQRVRC